MNGVSPTLVPQLVVEIGDVTRFTHRGTLTAFAGIDPGKTIPDSAIRKVYVPRRKVP